MIVCCHGLDIILDIFFVLFFFKNLSTDNFFWFTFFLVLSMLSLPTYMIYSFTCYHIQQSWSWVYHRGLRAWCDGDIFSCTQPSHAGWFGGCWNSGMKTALCTQEIITHTHMEKISLLSVESAIVIQDQVVVHFKRSVPKCKILLTKKLMILFLSDFFFFWVIFKNNICTKIAKGGDPDLPQTPSLFQFSI